jgi:hypothetical protein
VVWQLLVAVQAFTRYRIYSRIKGVLAKTYMIWGDVGCSKVPVILERLAFKSLHSLSGCKLVIGVSLHYLKTVGGSGRGYGLSVEGSGTFAMFPGWSGMGNI